MHGRVGFRARLSYRIDNFLAGGSAALFLALVISFLIALVALGGLRLLLNLISPDPNVGINAQIWFAFLQLTDPGNMAQDNNTPPLFKVLAVAAGMTGVVIFSALIAFLTTALDQAIAHLKKGHSRVLESGHTLILGWSPRIVEILRELFEANESEPDSVVVILAEREKEMMDDYLRTEISDFRKTRVVTRSGPTASLASLDRVSAHQAKSAIVLAQCTASSSAEEKAGSDAKVIKTVLALESHTRSSPNFNMVAEVFSKRHQRLAKTISPQRVTVVDTEEILAKIMIQTSRTSGLSVVYSELLSFEGCEIYFHHDNWRGVKFGSLQYCFPDGVPIGLAHADGSLEIRPDPGKKLADDDEILIVANDDSSIAFQGKPVAMPEEWEVPRRLMPRQQEKMAILGWSPKAPLLISEYADYVLEGSMVDIVVHHPSQAVLEEINSVKQKQRSIHIRIIDYDPLESRHLEALDPFSYNNLVILPQRPGTDLDPERIDSETIVVLLHLRGLSRAATKAGKIIETKIITEVLDSANQDLISQAGVNDFLISNRMVSMIFAQLSEEPRIQKVYDDLFEEDGSEIYVKNADLYFDKLPMTLRFVDLMRVAQKRNGEVCLGYKLKALEYSSADNYGVRLIPPKDSEITVSSGDALVVVAEDDR